MKVIIFGATGYVGFPIANAFVRNGHVVVGVTRSASKKIMLLENEMIPAIGDIFDPSTWGTHLSDADAVISVASGKLAEDGMKLLKTIESAAKTFRAPGAPKLVFIGTSGMWVYGDNRKTIRTEASPLDFDKMPVVAKWRPGLEQEIVKSEVLNGIVIRSSMCYGRAGSLWGMLFSQVEKGEISWMGTPGGAYAMVHVDDLAELYLLAAEKSHLVHGLIINASNERTESIDGILNAFATHVGIPLEKVTYRAPQNPLEQALCITVKVRPTLARSLLGWNPRKASMMDGIGIYYASYKAAINTA